MAVPHCFKYADVTVSFMTRRPDLLYGFPFSLSLGILTCLFLCVKIDITFLPSTKESSLCCGVTIFYFKLT